MQVLEMYVMPRGTIEADWHILLNRNRETRVCDASGGARETVMRLEGSIFGPLES